MNLTQHGADRPTWSARPRRGDRPKLSPLTRALVTAAIGLAIIAACFLPEPFAEAAIIACVPVAAVVAWWLHSIPGILSWPLLAALTVVLVYPNGLDFELWGVTRLTPFGLAWRAALAATIPAFFALIVALFVEVRE